MSVPWITSTPLFAASVHKIIATNTSLTVRGCECCFKRNWTEHEFEPWMVKKEKRPSVRPLVVLCRLYTVQAALTRGSVCVSVQDEAIKCVPQDCVCVPVWVEEERRRNWQVDWDLSAQISMEKNEVEVHENRHLRPMICSHSSLLYLYRHCTKNQDWRAHWGGLRFQSVSLLTHTHTHTFRIIFFSRQSQSCQCQMLICHAAAGGFVRLPRGR